MKNWRTYRKLKGSSLIYSLMISLLVSGLLTAYLMADFSFRGLVMQENGRASVHDNLRSALTLASRTLKYNAFEDFSWTNGSDSLWGTYEDWGAYKLLHSRASHLQIRGRMSALLGQKLPLLGTALILSDEGYPLVLMGNAQISGQVKVPKGEILIERFVGQAFKGSYPQGAQIRSSKRLGDRDFPKIPWHIQRVLDSLNSLSTQHHSPIPLEDEIDQSWDGPRAQIKTQGILKIQGGNYKGKIIISATEAIEVNADAALEDVILVAPIVRLHAGVRGRFQVFASDSLLLSDDVQLQFPSLLALSAKPNRPAYLGVKTRCRIEGAVLFYQPIDSISPSNLRPQVSIGENSMVYGTMHVAGNLALHGVVGGMVIAKGFVLRTAVGTVRNHLLNAQLIEDRLAPAYAGPFLFDKAKVEVLQIYPNEKENRSSEWQ